MGPSCGSTGFVVVDLGQQTLLPAGIFKGVASNALKGWWDSGELLAVRRPASWERGGGGRTSSDNLAPEAVAVDVASGRVRTVHRAREPYFALAGEEQGRRVLLAAEWKPDERSPKTRVRLTEYQDLRPAQSFSITIPWFNPVLRQAELDASGRYWILAFEFPPHEMTPHADWKHSIWLVSRNGRGFKEVTEREPRGLMFLDSFLHRGESVLVFLRSRTEPELHAYVIAER